MRVSVIVPVLNEIEKVESFLSMLQSLPGDWEVLFADGGSTDGTRERLQGRARVIDCPKGRARQMNAAAKKSTGDVLRFVHCDSILPDGAYRQIVQAVQTGTRFGCFQIAFDYQGPFMGCNTALSNRRAKRGRIAFGDQGIFMTRELFEEIGGFPDLPIMEDYELSLSLKRANIPLTVLDSSIVTSGRRYARRMPLLTMAQMFGLRCLYRMGVSPQKIAQLYRDIR